MTDPLNRERELTPSNIVPTSFSPAPEKYERQLGQEQRGRQAQLAQGYTLLQIDRLKNQRHLNPQKRAEAWQKSSPEQMTEAIKVAETARTVMLNDLPLWAGNLDVKPYDESKNSEFGDALPDVWNTYVQQVRETFSPAASNERFISGAGQETSVETPNDTPAIGDDVPIQVIFRPEIPGDAPRSVVEAPDQLTLGELLAKIEAKK